MDTGSDGSRGDPAAEADHRIANHMAMLSSYVRLKVREVAGLPDAPDRAAVLQLIEGIGAQIAAVAALHRMLSAGASPLSGDIGRQLDHICAAFRAGPACDAAISYTGDNGCVLPLPQILPVSQIVSEVITNALKYGHRTGVAGSIRVECRRQATGQILITIDDDGDGLSGGPAAVPPPKGIGNRLVEALARQVDGTIGYRSSQAGLCFSLSLPAEDALLRGQACSGESHAIPRSA